jgi:hypothetical protein
MGGDIMNEKLIELVNKVNGLVDYCDPQEYYITENFPKHGERNYQLFNLSMEIYRGMLLSDDVEGKLKDNNDYVLYVPLVDRIKDIISDEDITTLLFDDGTIKIKIV